MGWLPRYLGSSQSKELKPRDKENKDSGEEGDEAEAEAESTYLVVRAGLPELQDHLADPGWSFIGPRSYPL